MIVRVATALRKAGTTVEQFQRHWRTSHPEPVLALQGIVAYTQNHLVLREDGSPWLPWPASDSWAEITFSSIEEMDAAFASPQADIVRADSAHFIEPGRGGLTLCTRHVVDDRGSPDEGVKLVTALRRFHGCDQAAFEDVLRGGYAEAVGAGGPLRHELLLPAREAPANASAYCDAVDLLWFADAQEAAAFAVSEAAGRAACELTGRAFGAERLIARPVRVL